MWKLKDAGYKAWFVPSIQVFHTNIEDFYDLVKRKIRHGKTFAQLRVSENKFSSLKQFIYSIGSLTLPFLITYRRIKDVLNSKTYQVQFIISFPVTLAGIICWSLGEFLGYAKIDKLT